MPFMCQRDSFLTEFESEVVSCEPINDPKLCKTLSLEQSGKVYEIILKDTILFPEGGGQPDDRGAIDDVPILRVIRRGTAAVHYAVLKEVPEAASTEPFIPQQKVSTKIDWKRRFDHMQQHSGQHLITSVADQRFGFPTTSWWLGSDDSYIEMDTKDITEDQMKSIEDEVNLRIRECRPVNVDVVELDDPKLKVARGRNLPEDVKGQIRIVTMEGVESNVCCGTHVTNSSQLQVIKLLHVIKKKGKCHLYFLCGNRVLDKFSQQHHREQKLMGLLKTSPDDLTLAAEKLNIALKNSRKACQVISKDLANLEAQTFVQSERTSKLWTYHREYVDLDFSTTLLREIGPAEGTVVMVTLKTDGSSGHLILRDGNILGKDSTIKLGEMLCEMLDGKGNLRGNVFQAKVCKINAVDKAVKLAHKFVDDFLSTNS